MTVSFANLTIDWFGYATVRIEASDGFVAYLDPGRYGVLTGEWKPDFHGSNHPEPVDYDACDGDLVVVTHAHHYDSDGIRRVADPDATVVVSDAVDATTIARPVEPIEDLPFDVIRPDNDETIDVDGVTVRPVPAYNQTDGPRADANGRVSHPEGFGCGFLLEFDDTSVFWPGDTDVLEFHPALDVDVLLPPIGGTDLTMDRHEAASLAESMAPELVVPIHYDTFERLATDSRAFVADVAARGVPAVLDER